MIKITSTRDVMESIYDCVESEYKHNNNSFVFEGLVDLRVSLGMSKTEDEAIEYLTVLASLSAPTQRES